MELGRFIRILSIRIASLFYFSKGSKVIFYHDIHSYKKYTFQSTPIDLFKKHIQIIRENGYKIVNKITKERGEIEICFDDAYLGLYDNIDLIIELNIPIHLFVISSFMDKENHINGEQLLSLNKLSQIRISSHTETHQILNKASDKKIISELVNSKLFLESFLNKPINSICYPDGRFNKKVVELSKTVGYDIQYSGLPGFYFDDFLINVKRRSLVQLAGEKEFKAILRGGDHILAFWYKFRQYIK